MITGAMQTPQLNMLKDRFNVQTHWELGFYVIAD